MPILGVIASQISGRLFAPSGAYDSIATVNVGGAGAGAIVFSSIPATYKHLQIRAIARGSRVGALDELGMRFNGGSASITAHSLRSVNTDVFSSGNTAAGYSYYTAIASASETAGAFSTIIIDILDYSNTNKYKTFRALSGYDSNGTGRIYLSSGVQLDTAAINDVTMIPSNNNIAQYSSFALYGIKGN
jgi:hypothetical protein